MKRCPSCSQILVRRRLEGVEVDGCPSCGGVWLDDGELATLGKRNPDSLRQLDKIFVAGVQDAVAAHRSGLCPVCSQPLTAFQYASLAGIELDGCRQCKGIWLDDGEATQIADRLDPPELVLGDRAGPAAPSVAPSPAPVQTGAAAAPADLTSTQGMPIVRGMALGQVNHVIGFGGRVQSALAFIRGAYALAFEHKIMLVPIVIGLLAQFAVGGVAFAVYWFVLRAPPGHTEPSAQLWIVAAFIAYTFVAHFINYFTLGMSVNMVDAWLKGLEPSLRVAFADALKNIGGIVALAIVGTMVQMLVSSLRNNRGIWSRMLARSVQTFWTVASFLILPVIIVEDVGLFTAISRAKDIHRRNLVQIAVGEIGLDVVNFVLAMFVLGIAGLVYMATRSMGVSGLVISIGTGVLLVSVVGVFTSFAKGTYYTSLYLWAVETERTPQTVTVPSPIAAVFA